VFTTAGYRERERRVFGAAARVGVPLAWNLAGGYQEPLDKVLALHAITMEEALAAEAPYAVPQARETRGSSTGEGTSWEH
jgi:acetoin utilization deacetylase AcuC-like enzyme